jgi:hypothetical protein
VEDVEARMKLHRRVADVAEIVDDEVSQPDQARPLEAHGHDDVAVVAFTVAGGTQ